ncbi:transcription termination factor NusA [Haploplasma modicum]|jgi:transcription termination/antitermination protein NusA|uniref:transcription termination factor NusA n=1 Tax=Haploplasma modicum TaxID=2150 RepID=UPI00214C5B79|nr:transcription termination factor NusA [Haploplasma modicum]MCR1808966.1 transcription termination factor NusA [Haploplasma modicum]
MAKQDILGEIKEVAESMSLSENQVLEALKEGLIAGCKRTHQVNTCRVDFDEVKNKLKVFRQYLVIDEIEIGGEKTYSVLLLDEALKLSNKAKVGEILEIEVKPEDFSHFGMRDMKQRYKDVLLSHTKSNLYEFFKDKEGQMIKARIIEETPLMYKVDLGKEMTILPKTEVLEKDHLHPNAFVYVYVSKVESKSKGPKIFVTRKDKHLVEKLMELFIPEIKDKTVEIVGISRVPGERSKVGVRSNDPSVDPIGSCIGEGGTRIREIVQALSGEKIDLFRWSDNERELIENALQPSDVIAVTKINPKDKTALAIVPNDQLSLAIGKAGQNVKLAVLATGWSIDIKSEAMANEEGILY